MSCSSYIEWSTRDMVHRLATRFSTMRGWRLPSVDIVLEGLPLALQYLEELCCGVVSIGLQDEPSGECVIQFDERAN